MTDHSQTQKQIIDKKEQTQKTKNPKQTKTQENKKLGGGNDSNFVKTYKIYPTI